MYIKKILIITVLFIILFILNEIYYIQKSNAKTLNFKNELIPIIILYKDNIEVNIENIFYIKPFYKIYSPNEYYIDSKEEYFFDEIGNYDVEIKVKTKNDESSRIINIEVKPKDIEYVEIIKEISNNDRYNNNPESKFDIDNNKISGIKDISIKKDSDINELAYLLSKDIVSNGNVSIDFTDVNLSKCGTYSVYYYLNGDIYECKLTIFD